MTLSLAGDGFWNMGKSGVFTMLAQRSPMARESSSSLGEQEQRLGLPERPEKSVGGLQLDGYVLCGEVITLRDLAK